MAKLTWGALADRRFETGVSHGVLYTPDAVTGEYDSGVAWNGLTAVTEAPSGAESNKQYADNSVYVNLISAEEFGGTIEAFTAPDKFGQHDGTAAPKIGVYVGQQSRKAFGFSFQTKVGTALDGDDGYKIHLVYGCQAAPSEKGYTTVNDSPEAMALSWEFTTTPVAVTGHKDTALLVIDSTKVDPADLAALELLLYGGTSTEPKLPLPDEVIALFSVTP